MKKLIFIKFGGSLITHKDKVDSVRLNVINTLADQIKKITKREKMLLIIGNGNGSTGHYLAQKYRVANEAKSEKQKYGFSLVQNNAILLNQMITEALLRKRINAISIHPSSFLISSNGKPKSVNIEPILGMLRLDIMPIVHGDIVFDDIKGSHIFTTEKIFSLLIDKLGKNGYRTQKVIYLTTVGGFLDSNKQIIKKLTKKNYSKVKKYLFVTQGFDVTGGMKHKIDQAISLANKGIKVYIAGGIKKDSLYNAIFDKNFSGTIIE